MLPRTYRFSASSSGIYTLKYKSHLFFMKARLNTESNSRFSCVISKKVSSSAVIRNRIKRYMHEVVRPYLLQTNKTYDILVILTPQAKNEEKEVYEKEMKLSFNKLNLL